MTVPPLVVTRTSRKQEGRGERIAVTFFAIETEIVRFAGLETLATAAVTIASLES